MNRARATALVLVNWKGVFFERYLLDRHVTALEGANGAGKTTVMIAAYVVLLPDLTRLKFTNLGETGATGGDRGIYGRLGEPGASYAALEVELDGAEHERLLLGVCLERKAAPALSLTPFVISSMPPGLAVDQLFLQEDEREELVATLDEITASSKAAGARIDVFDGPKEYFAHLFERGVSPLRLSLDEERNKFNDMLRTSMTGGISRTLTSDLRGFLFKQQTGLFDTLTRMRKSLDACRRTRLEVVESRVLEQEINGIYAAGHAMFQAALDAAETRVAEHRREAEQARSKVAAERERTAELATRVRETEQRQQGLAARLERARASELGARERSARLTRALAASQRLAAIEAERSQLLPEVEAARSERAEAQLARERAKAVRDAAQRTLGSAASGLASLQAGLEELHRQAHSHRRVRTRLEAARELLSAAPESSLSGAQWLQELARALEGTPARETCADAQQRLQRALSELDRLRAEREREADVAARRRADHEAARAALVELCAEPVEHELEARARAALGQLNELELLGARVAELSSEQQRLSALAERQRRARAAATALGLAASATARDVAGELARLDAALLAAGTAQHEHEAAARELAEREASTRRSLEQLRARAAEHRRLSAVAARLTASGRTLPGTRAELGALLRASHEACSELGQRSREQLALREAALEHARRLEDLGGAVSAELVRLAERVDGRLLATRYEELEPDDARRVQAELGPLAGAIVVDDLQRALDVLLDEAHQEQDLWLLQAGADWPALPASSRADRPHSVVVDIGHGVRVSRLPRDVSLGRAGRQRLAERARADAEAAAQASATLDARRRQEQAATGDLELLLERWDDWSAGDPAAELERLERELESLARARQEQLERSREQRVESAALASRREAVRAELAEPHLLDPPDHDAAAEQNRALLERARSAAAELKRSAKARRTLLALVHELASAPPEVGVLAAWQEQRPRLAAERDRLFAVAESLALVLSEPAALGWSDAERALDERRALVPELEAQHERALRELAEAERAQDQREASWEQATARAQATSARLAAIDAHRERARAELGEDLGEQASSAACEAAALELERLAAAVAELEREQRGSEAELALARERHADAARRTHEAEQALARELAASQPSEAAWRALADAARAAGVLELDARLVTTTAPATSAQRALEADGKRELLCDRLAAARGGAELASALRARAAGAAKDHLATWLEVRTWLLLRLPAQIAELGQPLLGLSRLRDDLGELESRLERQEGELRGTSADVARSIEVQLRRASAQVKRLNHALEGVSFGSIQGIKVELERVEKMEQVLRALREGETQELLFQSNLPIEEALDEIFRRHAGGRTGGQKLIDYREYLDLSVRIRRRTNDSWERVNPSQVSTGEAIGVGAALMMVILSEWERDDQLLRQKKSFGSLRFLFLDEANRLSQDNLGVLFDLCGVLDLQLLIAAPEVARAQGNTTYRLVRRVSDDGREEVLVTGRRATLPESSTTERAEHSAPHELGDIPKAETPEPAQRDAVQLGLL